MAVSEPLRCEEEERQHLISRTLLAFEVVFLSSVLSVIRANPARETQGDSGCTALSDLSGNQ
ncbi:MAG: hypothetical protein ACTXOO_01280 [Sodalis sp. (in: enterobacteria)]